MAPKVAAKLNEASRGRFLTSDGMLVQGQYLENAWRSSGMVLGVWTVWTKHDRLGRLGDHYLIRYAILNGQHTAIRGTQSLETRYREARVSDTTLQS